MKLHFLAFILVVTLSCKDNERQKVATTVEAKDEKPAVPNTDLEIYDFEGFKKFLNKKDDKIYVINFWATWCGPCVKELPCLLYTSPSPRDLSTSRMPSSA